jgi:cell wall-associated NlpC family hydrolase
VPGTAAAVTARLRAIAETVGPGWPSGAGPAAVLDDAGARLADVAAGISASWRTAETGWSGAAADRAAESTAATTAEIDALTAELDRISAATVRAAAAVANARERLEAIIAEFEERAAEIEAALDGPAADRAVAKAGRQAIDEASAVVEALRADLDGQTAAVHSPAPTTPATAPGGLALPALPSGFGSGSGGGGGGGMPMQSAWSGLDEGLPRPVTTPDEGVFGAGVSVGLPDGTTANAPNAVAASAVRHALTQLGVPYHWGGTTPGVGLDCSGLTQWAYREAGLDIPRLAQEQDIGASISRGSLRPGDLAVWDGHVAMIVGNGMMVEAGDPVQLSPIRTTNAGQGFQGFWRPTA